MTQLAADELDVASHRIRPHHRGYGPDTGRGLHRGEPDSIERTAAPRSSMPPRRSGCPGRRGNRRAPRGGGVIGDHGAHARRFGARRAGKRRLGCGELVASDLRAVRARADGRASSGGLGGLFDYRRSVPRVDIPAKVTGLPSYVHDMRLPGMVHARVVRRRLRYAATPVFLRRRRQPGVARVVRDGSFVAVVGPREWRSVQALRGWGFRGRDGRATRRRQGDCSRILPRLPADIDRDLDSQAMATPDACTLEARGASHRCRHATQGHLMHGAIGPSCAAGMFKDGAADGVDAQPGRHPFRMRSPHCSRSRPTACTASTSRARGATGTTGRTTRRPTLR